MSTLTVKVNCKATDNFSGYRLFCSYTEKFSLSGEVKNGDSEWLTRPGLAACSILPSANKQQWLGELDLPELAGIEPSIVVQVKAQDGSITHEQVFRLSRETTSIELTSSSGFYPNLLASSHSDRQAIRLRGRVVDFDGQLAIAGQQLLLMAAKEAASDDIVAATKTDAQGYFSLDFKSDVFSRAFIKVANYAPQSIALVNGKLPERVIISVAASAVTVQGGDKEGDCACHTPVPMLPDAEDIINAPEIYTSDLSGGCVVLNKPNRTVEEFDFFGVVRTTEPDIVGFSLPEPQYLLSDQIREFGQYRPHRPGSSIPKAGDAPKGDSQLHGDGASPAPKDPRSPQTAPTKGEPGRPPGRGATLRTDTNPAPGASATTSDGRPQQAGAIGLNKLIDPRILKNISKGRGYTEEIVAEAVKQTEEAMIDAAVAKSLSTVASRALLSASNPLDWDNEPTFYQAATVAHGHILHFKQIWKANGFSLGDLLYSLPLAPGQKRQVAVLDWERREIAARTESLEAEESLAANLTRDRDINEIVSASLKENVVGASLGLSASKGSSQGSSGPGSGDQSALSLVSGSAGGIGGAASVGFQHGSRQATATSLQKIRDRVGQAASAVRSQRSTVVQSVTQGETLRAQTEVIANYNHCHAITVEYFEVLRHFAVQHKLVDVQECLFVPLMMSPFDKQKALRWREPLQRALIDRRLSLAFDALERMEHNYDGADFPATTYAAEPIKQIDGMLRVSFRLVRPGDKDGDEIAPDMTAWAGVAALTGINVIEFFNTHLKNSSNPDKAFLDALGKQIVEELIERVEIYATGSSDKRLPLQLELASEFKNRTPLQIRVRSKGALPANLTRQSIDELEIKIRGLTADSSIEQILPPGTKITLELMQLRYRTENIQHSLVSVGRLSDNLIDKDGVSLPAPISQEELRNPRNEDRERVNTLLRHLHDNIEHYHKAIWLGMDSSRRFMLLDGITAPNASGRSIASVVENRLIGIVGNSLVLPVVPGLQLDPVYRVDPADPVSLLEVYQPLEETAPLLISVPTKGVYAESVMGSCNSCEKKDETRFWRWEESPLPDQPSPIGLLSTDSRQSAAPDLTAKDFAQPIINLQNAPSAPDPSGLAAMMQLIGKGDSFRDLTGLNQNQLNAAAGLDGAFRLAGASGEAAAKAVASIANLQKQKQLSRDGAQIIEAVEAAYSRGSITPEQRNEIIGGYFKGVTAADQTQPSVSMKDYRELMAVSAETGVSSAFNPTTGSFELKPTQPLANTNSTGAGSVSSLAEDTPLLEMNGSLDLSAWKWDVEPLRFDEWSMRKDFEPAADLCREYFFRESSTSIDFTQNPDPDYYVFVPKSAIRDDATCKVQIYFQGNPNKNGVSNPVIKYGLRRWAMENGFILVQVGMKQKPKKTATELTYTRLRHLLLKAWSATCQDLTPEMFGSVDSDESSPDSPILEAILNAADSFKISVLRLSASSYGIVSLGASLGNGGSAIPLSPKATTSSIYAADLRDVVDRVSLLDAYNDSESVQALNRVFKRSSEKIFNYNIFNGPIGEFQSMGIKASERESWYTCITAICCTRILTDFLRYKEISKDASSIKVPQDVLLQLLDAKDNICTVSGGPSGLLPGLPAGLECRFPERGHFHSGFFSTSQPNETKLSEYFKAHKNQVDRLGRGIAKPQTDRSTAWPETTSSTKCSDPVQIGMGAFILHPNPGSDTDFHYHLIGQSQNCAKVHPPDKEHKLIWIEGDSGNAGLFVNSVGLIAHGLFIAEIAHELFN